jgi:hypothetical protein
VTTAQISQVEIATPTLDPPFGDILASTSAGAGKFTLSGAVTLESPTASHGSVRLRGSLAPKVLGEMAKLRIYANPAKGTSAVAHTLVAVRSLSAGAHRYDVHVHLKQGERWVVHVTYANPGLLSADSSRDRTLVV